jgi:hypothetical protein
MEAVTEALPGFLLIFKPKETQKIKDMLIDEGYTPDSDGLKDFILAALAEPELKPEERIGAMVGNFIADHPEIVTGGAKMAGRVMAAFMKKRK